MSYHQATVNGLQGVVDLVDGYTDPQGYRWSEDNSRFDQLDLRTEFPFFDRVSRASSGLIYPDGRVVPVHDAWPNANWSRQAPPRTQLLPAAEHACLHHSHEGGQLQARLHFAPGYGHKHRDLLSLVLWADGREMASDIGYTHTIYRKAWAASTPAHNTVVVDQTEQETRGDCADVTLFDTVPHLLSTVEASATAAYPEKTSMYRRQLVLVEGGGGHPYVVDVFRVVGGRRHDWLLHGSADFDQAVNTDVKLEPHSGNLLGRDVAIRMPDHERDGGDAGGHNFALTRIRELQRSTFDRQWSATYTFDDAGSMSLRTIMLGQPGTTVFTGRCPSVRRAKEDNSKVDEYTMPVIIASREGDELSSTFVAVHEVFHDKPMIRRVRQVDTSLDTKGAVAVEVTTGNERDLIFFVPEEFSNERLKLPSEPEIEMSGRTGFMRFQATLPCRQ